MYVRSLTVARRGRHLAVGLSLAIIGCAVPGPSRAQQPAVAQENSGDPLEDANRVVFDFNQTVDRIVLVPVAKTYRTILPSPDRDSVRDFLRNLNEPLVFANDLLQAQPHLAAKTVARFAVNSAVGVGGLIDVATRIDLPHHSNDLGVTFGVWGIGDGPYLMLPVFGPSNVRDLAGQVGESFADPDNRTRAAETADNRTDRRAARRDDLRSAAVDRRRVRDAAGIDDERAAVWHPRQGSTSNRANAERTLRTMPFFSSSTGANRKASNSDPS
jgi:ABC-type transporter lipoprotein component MlaA